MEISTKVVKYSVAVCFTAIFVSMCFLLYAAVNSGAIKYNAILDKIFGKSEGPTFARYEGKVVDGNFVRSMVKQYGSEYFIRIKTDKCPESFGVYANSGHDIFTEGTGLQMSLVSMQSASSKQYVNSTDLFEVGLLYSSWDEIGNPVLATVGNLGDLVGVYFEQKSKSNSTVTTTKLESKLQKLKNMRDAMKVYNWNEQIEAVKKKNAELKRDIDKLENDNSNILTRENKDLVDQFNNAYGIYNNAYESCQDLIQEMLNKFNTEFRDSYGLDLTTENVIELDSDTLNDESPTSLGYYVKESGSNAYLWSDYVSNCENKWGVSNSE